VLIATTLVRSGGDGEDVFRPLASAAESSKGVIGAERRSDARLTDQIEFANVILLNKTDMMAKDQVDKVEQLVKTLNP